MRRAAVILLALVLVPSIAAVSWVRCAFDGAARAACCCPDSAGRAHQAPASGPSLREASCCSATESTSAVPAERSSPPASVEGHMLAPAFAVVVEPARGRAATHARARPRAQGDPPDSLYARHCSLLL